MPSSARTSTSRRRARRTGGPVAPVATPPRQSPSSVGRAPSWPPPARPSDRQRRSGRERWGADVLITEIVGLALLLALVLSIAAIAVRRSLLTRSGGVDLCW